MFPRTALVTGGASGIGAAVVAALERHGAEVQVLDLRGGFDVGRAQDWEGVGAVELCCLNAGVTTGESSLGRLSEEAYRRALATNLDGVVFGVRRMSQVMAPGGTIVVTASLAGLAPLPLDPVYTLTKHGVVGFVRAVATQLEQQGIRICALAPGFADTPLLDPMRDGLRRAGFPLLSAEDVAAAVLGAVRGAHPGEVVVVQPGRAPEPMRFPNLPGPRDAGGGRVGAPPGGVV